MFSINYQLYDIEVYAPFGWIIFIVIIIWSFIKNCKEKIVLFYVADLFLNLKK